MLYNGLLVVLFITFGYSLTKDAPTSDVNVPVRTFIVQNKKPFTWCEDPTQCEGLIPDIINKLGKRLNFTAEFVLADVNEPVGQQSQNEQWTGLVGQLQQRKADVLAIPLTRTSALGEVLDFLYPFGNHGFNVIVKNPILRHMEDIKISVKKEENGTSVNKYRNYEFGFAIDKPFTVGVWLMCTAMAVVVWLILWMCNRWNPYEHGCRFENGVGDEDDARQFNVTGSLWFVIVALQLQGWNPYEHGCHFENGVGDEDDARQFNVTGSLWFVIVALQLQGYDRYPRSKAAKLLAGSWMVFALVTVIAYTASAANQMFWAEAVKLKDSVTPPIRILKDLITHNDGYEYGVVRDSAAFYYIMDERRDQGYLKKMRQYFQNEGNRYIVDSLEDGFKKAREEKFALIIDDINAKFELSEQEPCDLSDTGITFGMQSYGFAMWDGREEDFEEQMIQEMLQLRELGYIERLEEEWYAPNGLCRLLKETSESMNFSFQSPGQLSFDEYWSVSLLFLIGFIASCITAAIEIFYYRYKGRNRGKYEAGDWRSEN